MERKTIVSKVFRTPSADYTSNEFNEWIKDGNEDIEIISSNMFSAPNNNNPETIESVLHVIYRDYPNNGKV